MTEMQDDPSYRSFILRLWHPAKAGKNVWHGEVEHIQSGTITSFTSSDEIIRMLEGAVGIAVEVDGKGANPALPKSDLPLSSIPVDELTGSK